MEANKVCVITGASKGFGEFLSNKFWKAGYSLCLIGRNIDELNKFVDNLPEARNQTVSTIVCDLGNANQITEVFGKFALSLPNVDVLINNAGIQGPIGSFWENNPDEWRETIEVNLFAPIILCRIVIPIMRKIKHGSIINLSGGGATTPRPNFSAYATAKAGLVRFSETIAKELIVDGIRVNCIAPGVMKTSMIKKILEKAVSAGESEAGVAKKVFESTDSTMDRAAELALFLASDESKNITGKLISAIWDDWENWPAHSLELKSSDIYTLRRVVGRDRGFSWGDK